MKGLYLYRPYCNEILDFERFKDLKFRFNGQKISQFDFDLDSSNTQTLA